jgi:hypothetical protein
MADNGTAYLNVITERALPHILTNSSFSAINAASCAAVVTVAEHRQNGNTVSSLCILLTSLQNLASDAWQINTGLSLIFCSIHFKI